MTAAYTNMKLNIISCEIDYFMYIFKSIAIFEITCQVCLIIDRIKISGIFVSLCYTQKFLYFWKVKIGVSILVRSITIM